LVWIVLLVAPYLLHQLTKLLLIYEACRRFSLDKTTGNFESIITSPLPSGILVKECAKGLFHRFLSPVLLLTVLNCICLLNAFYLAGGATGYETKLLMLGTVAGIVVLFIDLWSWRWIGMCYGLAAPTMMRSLWEVFLRVRVPAFLSFFFLLLVGVVFGISNELCAFFFCWIGTLAIWSLMAGSRAKKILLQSFHEFAAGQGKIPGLVILEEEEIELKPAQPVLLGTPQEA
jgi:hypothetical protein